MNMNSITVNIESKDPGKPLGIKIGEINGQLYVTEVKPESPFQRTSLRRGQRVVAINHVPCQDFTPRQAVDMLKQDLHVSITVLPAPETAVPIVTGVPVNAAASVEPYRPTALPPPGVDAGGIWGQGRYVGPKSASMLTTLFIIGLFFLPACLCALVPIIAPFDERFIYRLGGKFYSAEGECLGGRERIREFRAMP